MSATSGWSYPEEVAKELFSAEGTTGPTGAIPGYALGWYDLDTLLEVHEQYSKWMADAIVTLLGGKYEWDAFFMHYHPTDWIYHIVMTEMEEALTPDKELRDRAWDAHLKVYQYADRMLAQILEVLGDDTLIILVGDHGAVADGPPFNPYDALAPAGLIVFEEQERASAAGKAVRMQRMYGPMARAVIPDPTKSKAIPMNSLYVYINLKGRNPDGIVEPEDYEKVQREIIDALYTYVDPETGKRPIALALSKQDARILGLYGDHIGDVVYAVYPDFGGQHGNILPTAEWGIGSLKGLLTFTGPGTKKNYRLERTSGLEDIVPTICYMMDWPVPGQTEGKVLYQVFEDANFKMKQATELRESLSKMEAALAQGSEES